MLGLDDKWPVQRQSFVVWLVTLIPLCFLGAHWEERTKQEFEQLAEVGDGSMARTEE